MGNFLSDRANGSKSIVSPRPHGVRNQSAPLDGLSLTPAQHSAQFVRSTGNFQTLPDNLPTVSASLVGSQAGETPRGTQLDAGVTGHDRPPSRPRRWLSPARGRPGPTRCQTRPVGCTEGFQSASWRAMASRRVVGQRAHVGHALAVAVEGVGAWPAQAQVGAEVGAVDDPGEELGWLGQGRRGAGDRPPGGFHRRRC